MKFLIFIKHIAKLILKKEKIIFYRIYKNSNNVFYDDLQESDLINTNKKIYKVLVTIDGPGFSGSSAFGDFLGEFSNCTSLGGVDMRENPERGKENSYEIDFFREPNGIFDLERICFTNVGRIRDNAIHEFIKICNQYYHSNISIYNDYFYSLAKKFIKDITDYTIRLSPTQITYVPKNLSVKEYRKYAKEFLVNFIKGIPSNDYLILDNLMSISKPDIETLRDYFGDFKLIYVLSDPRDIYTRARLSPGNDWVPVDPEIFVKGWNRVPAIYKNTINDSLYCASFDNLCNNYEIESNKIMNFLGLTEKEHIYKYKYFNPEISINNTNIFSKLNNKNPIEYIYNNLKDYCWNKTE